MVPRYSRPDMVAIWTPEARFKIWFEIEAHATDALAELGVVPKEAAAAIWAAVRPLASVCSSTGSWRCEEVSLSPFDRPRRDLPPPPLPPWLPPA